MKKNSSFGLSVIAVLAALSVQGAGFALYEGSASAVALGGGVMGKAVDGSAVFYNPATMSDFTNTVVTIGMVTEHPTADVSLGSSSARKMDPGFFVLPHAYVIQPLGYDFTFGMGVAPEFGLGSHYHQGWGMAWDTQKTLIEGVTFSPNLSYAITPDWSVAAGLRLMYLSFDQTSYPNAPGGLGVMRNHLKGDNHMLDFGWEISTRYKINKKLSFGAMYRSYMDCKLKGENHTTVAGYNDPAIKAYGSQLAQQAYAQMGSPYGPWAMLPSAVTAPFVATAEQGVREELNKGARRNTGDASAKVRLPASLSVGFNYELTPEIDLGTALTWTQWSTLKHLLFNLPGDDRDLYLGWKDTYRLGTGAAWKFYDGWKLMGSYVYDMDPCRHNGKYGTTMLPPGDRHIVSTGLSYRFCDNWEIAGTAGYVIMCENSLRKTDAATRRTMKFDTHKGRSMAFGLSLSYYF